MKIVYFDTETTGLAPNGDFLNNYKLYPHIVQIAWIIEDTEKASLEENNFCIYPLGWECPKEATEVHGFTNDYLKAHGVDVGVVLQKFIKDCESASLIVAHNMQFDARIVLANCVREFGLTWYDMHRDCFTPQRMFCTMKSTTDWVAISRWNGYKWPTLSELYEKCFNSDFDAHNAASDTKALYDVYKYLKANKIV